jgi:hypothetical protein
MMLANHDAMGRTVHQFMSTIGRKCSVVNLDPANDRTSYPCALDVRDLVTLDEVMAEEELGPNGGTLWAIEELEHNIEWLEKGLVGLGGEESSTFAFISPLFLPDVSCSIASTDIL